MRRKFEVSLQDWLGTRHRRGDSAVEGSYGRQFIMIDVCGVVDQSKLYFTILIAFNGAIRAHRNIVDNSPIRDDEIDRLAGTTFQ